MRSEVVRYIADADPEELAAGLMMSRLKMKRSRLADGQVRVLFYLPPAEPPPVRTDDRPEELHGLKRTPAKSRAERRGDG